MDLLTSRSDNQDFIIMVMKLQTTTSIIVTIMQRYLQRLSLSIIFFYFFCAVRTSFVLYNQLYQSIRLSSIIENSYCMPSASSKNIAKLSTMSILYGTSTQGGTCILKKSRIMAKKIILLTSIMKDRAQKKLKWKTLQRFWPMINVYKLQHRIKSRTK